MGAGAEGGGVGKRAGRGEVEEGSKVVERLPDTVGGAACRVMCSRGEAPLLGGPPGPAGPAR